MTAEYKVVFAAEIERRSRLLIPRSLRWACQKPSETLKDWWLRRYEAENARLAALTGEDLTEFLKQPWPGVLGA